MDSLLSTKDLQFLNITYPNLQIPPLKTTFITGPSGCGKSTLFKLFNATLSPTFGTIFYKDTNIANINTLSLRKSLLLTPQIPYLFNGSIEDNFREYYKFREQSITKEAMKTFCEICCVDMPLECDTTKLSGGQRQRVFLSIFLSFSKEVLLLDEPTSALDEATAKTLLRQIKEYCSTQAITLLIISHTPQLYKFANHLITLDKYE